jgi:hypothetical protein
LAAEELVGPPLAGLPSKRCKNILPPMELQAVFTAHVVEIISVVKILMDAMRNNTLDKYRNNARTANEGIELPAIANEPASQSTIAVQLSSSADEASHGRDRVIETSVANAAPKNS